MFVADWLSVQIVNAIAVTRTSTHDYLILRDRYHHTYKIKRNYINFPGTENVVKCNIFCSFTAVSVHLWYNLLKCWTFLWILIPALTHEFITEKKIWILIHENAITSSLCKYFMDIPLWFCIGERLDNFLPWYDYFWESFHMPVDSISRIFLIKWLLHCKQRTVKRALNSLSNAKVLDYQGNK